MKRQGVVAGRRAGAFTWVSSVLLAVVTGLAIWGQPEVTGDQGHTPSVLALPSWGAPTFDWPALRRLWHARIEEVEKRGLLPILDIESSFGDDRAVTDEFAQVMDECGVAVIALGQEGRLANLQALVQSHPSLFIPVPFASLHRNVVGREDANPFLDLLFANVLRGGYPTMGEFFFRHYPSNVQQRGDAWEMADVHIPIDGPYVNRIFAFAQESHIPFQIHYEVEDSLLPPLEKMLARYPGATVVWCHVGRIRYLNRSRRYGAEYVRGLLARYPNLYFDTSCSDPTSVWPLHNGTGVSRMWDEHRGHLQPAWVDVVTSYPDRFLAALDLGSDRLDVRNLRRYTFWLRHFLAEFPPDVQRRIAYRNSWTLLFHEQF